MKLISSYLVDTDSFATVTVTGIGSIVVNDGNTLLIAESFLDILRRGNISSNKRQTKAIEKIIIIILFYIGKD